MDQYLQGLFVLANDPATEVQKLVCAVFVQLIEVRQSFLEPHLNNIIEYMLLVNKDTDDEVALEACEIWSAYCDAQLPPGNLKEFLPLLIPDDESLPDWGQCQGSQPTFSSRYVDDVVSQVISAEATWENFRKWSKLSSSDAFEANSKVEVNDQSSHLVEAMPEVDVASHRPVGEQPKQIRTSFKDGYDRVRSNDIFETAGYFGSISKLSGTIDYMSKSQTITSSHAYYDGRVSSFDGNGIEISFYENPQDMAMLQLETEQDSKRLSRVTKVIVLLPVNCRMRSITIQVNKKRSNC
ncbi:hypothetical protein Dsin_012577 [Dipteronia sinensis]|uniref:Uncharacterized protein n=1 Tax=Dipteronia sinensis TaxID=43782 RepID=A0AAE0AJM2_9ROSI|nr:hypothetical protein Dsin_012577 [Dipteronia sinensis]